MKEIKVFNNNLTEAYKNKLTEMIHNFDNYDGGVGNRNIIKIINIDGVDLNIKAFKIPNLINRIAYNFFRKSKAQRSFEYAKATSNALRAMPTLCAAMPMRPPSRAPRAIL